MNAYKLISTTGDQSIDVKPDQTLVVGRAVTSDFPIYDPTVSRRHAELSVASAGGVFVNDLGSANGTFVNGQQISDTVAHPDDVVTFGKAAFKVVEVTAPAVQKAPPPEVGAGVKPPPDATIVRQVAIKDPSAESAAVRLSGQQHAKKAMSVEEAQAQKLSVLLDISKELSKQQEVDKLLGKIVDICFEVMNVDRVSILLLEGESEPKELVPRVAKNRLGDGGGVKVPSTIARRAVEERLAILSDNAAQDSRFGGASIVMQSVRSAMAAPLIGSNGRVLGLIYVDNMTALSSFGDEDLEFLIAFSGIAQVAIENSQLTERVQREAVVRSNFERYFAPDLASQIADQAEAVQLGGAKRQVVVFFSDIRGFTSMSETMNPDEIASLLTEYFTEMVEIVFEHGGTLDKFMGDAIMALWGAPLSHSDDADRAMRAAIEMQETLTKLNEKWAQDGREQQVHIGIGINFGEVFAGNIGSDRRLEYTVIGDAVNIASRLCSKAGPGEIMVSEPLFTSLTEPPEVEPLEPIELKGKAQAVPVYKVKR